MHQQYYLLGCQVCSAPTDSDVELIDEITLAGPHVDGTSAPGSSIGKRKVDEYEFDSGPEELDAVKETHTLLHKESGTLRTTASVSPFIWIQFCSYKLMRIDTDESWSHM